MRTKITLFTATAATLVLYASLSQAFPSPARVAGHDNIYKGVETSTPPIAKPSLNRTVKPTDYSDYKSMYPYALMSYFAEMYKLDSTNTAKQEALSQRLDILENAGFTLVTDANFVPETYRNFFINKNSPKTKQKGSALINGFYHKETHFKARLFINKSNKTLVLAIAGTNFASSTSMRSAYDLSTGTVPVSAKIALALSDDLLTKHSKYRLILTGASQGGAVAQHVALNLGSRAEAWVFNSQGLHKTLYNSVSSEQLTRIHHAYVAGEMLNGENYHLGKQVIQTQIPVKGTLIPVNDTLYADITNAFYNSHSTATSTGMYYMVTRSGMLHWTGSLLKAVEHHAKYGHLPSLY